MRRAGREGVKFVRARVRGAAAFSLIFLLSAAAPSHAQTPPQAPPLPGFVPPYEITRIVRSAGFSPLAPPLREGTTYVVRATDFRGILMRVVVDARSGAIRAVNRIVAGPGPYGQIGMLPPPYGEPPAYGPPGYPPPAYGPPAYGPSDAGAESAPQEENIAPPAPAAAPPPAIRPAAHPLVSGPPPLPRPRPAELASRKATEDAKFSGQPSTKPSPAPAISAPAAAKKLPAPAPLPD